MGHNRVLDVTAYLLVRTAPSAALLLWEHSPYNHWIIFSGGFTSPRMRVVILYSGRAIAQAVNRRLPTAPVRVRYQVRSCGICGGPRGIGVGFLIVFRFHLPILTRPGVPYSSIIRGWYSTLISGLRTKWSQSHPTQQKIKKKILIFCVTLVLRCPKFYSAMERKSLVVTKAEFPSGD
jgi:hypothetical protein